MKKFVVLYVGMLLILMGCATDQTQEISHLKQEIADLKALAGPPPSSLDDLYPPIADRPIFQIGMFAMDGPLTGIAIETERGNFEQAVAHFRKFEMQYAEISKMVPEWEKGYPAKPLEDLRASLETNDRGKVMAAFGSVINTCNECHVLSMPKVQQKYHWEDSFGIEVSDPITKENLTYNQLMAYLNMSFNGIGVELGQGRTDNALRQFESFDKRFQVLKETCQACHETERKYYVDQTVQGLIDELGAALRTSSPDATLVGTISQQIGTESCLKCHWVHIPAAYAKVVWKN